MKLSEFTSEPDPIIQVIPITDGIIELEEPKIRQTHILEGTKYSIEISGSDDPENSSFGMKLRYDYSDQLVAALAMPDIERPVLSNTFYSGFPRNGRRGQLTFTTLSEEQEHLKESNDPFALFITSFGQLDARSIMREQMYDFYQSYLHLQIGGDTKYLSGLLSDGIVRYRLNTGQTAVFLMVIAKMNRLMTDGRFN